MEATPYDLLDQHRSGELPGELWEEVLRWMEIKGRELLTLARAERDIIGTHCPFCAYVLPAGELINTLLYHIAGEHSHEKVSSLVLGGERLELGTHNDSYPLLPAEEE